MERKTGLPSSLNCLDWMEPVPRLEPASFFYLENELALRALERPRSIFPHPPVDRAGSLDGSAIQESVEQHVHAGNQERMIKVLDAKNQTDEKRYSGAGPDQIAQDWVMRLGHCRDDDYHETRSKDEP